MRFVIGIDGGGTKTSLKLADIDGNLLASCTGGPSNINSIDKVDVEKALKELITGALEEINGTLGECEAICIGTAGAGRADDAKIIEDIIRGIGFPGRVEVTNDARTALYGGIGSEEGIITICGTGSICYGRNSAGDICRAGGWGHMIGDEGSGYDIGIKALNCIMRSYDGREPYTALTPAVLEVLNMRSPEELIAYVYRNGTGKKEIAAVAEIVDKVCDAGDAAAVRIQKNAAYELYLCAGTVIEKLGFCSKPANMAIGGSVITKSGFIKNEFCSIINKIYPLIKISDMKNDASWGAVLIALDRARERKW